jgi:hypothetical protein
MKKRKWLLGITLFLLLLSSGGIGWRLLAQSRVTEGNFERIEMGMTEAEVESLLGGPAAENNYECFLGALPTSDGVGGNWYGSDVTIHVSFLNNAVAMKRLRPPGREETTLDNWWWSTNHRFHRYFGS